MIIRFPDFESRLCLASLSCAGACKQASISLGTELAGRTVSTVGRVGDDRRRPFVKALGLLRVRARARPKFNLYPSGRVIGDEGRPNVQESGADDDRGRAAAGYSGLTEERVLGQYHSLISQPSMEECCILHQVTRGTGNWSSKVNLGGKGHPAAISDGQQALWGEPSELDPFAR